MKKTVRILLMGALLFAGFPALTNAQNALLRYADKQYGLYNYEESADGYVKAYHKKERYRSAKGAAESYERMGNYTSAYDWWEKTVGYEQAVTSDFVHLAGSANRIGKLEEVLMGLDTLSEREGLDKFSLDSLDRWYTEPKTGQLEGLDQLNSASSDFGYAEDLRGNRYFTSDRGASGEGHKASIRFDVSNKMEKDYYEWTGRDFLKVYRADSAGNINGLEMPVPDTWNFSDPIFINEAQVVFYTVTRKVKRQNGKKIRPEGWVNPEFDYGQGSEGYIDYHSELYYSRVGEDGSFQDYQAVPWNDATGHSLITPYIDEQAGKLYFASDMAGGFGGFDLYSVDFDDNFKFGTPENLGAKINTSGNERDPFLAADKLYFSSDGHFGMGGYDLFVSERLGTDFGSPANLGQPYNSADDDFALSMGMDGSMYLSSDREGGKGLDDIYRFQETMLRFLGRVLDCDGELIAGGFISAMADSGGSALDLEEEGGELRSELEPGERYSLKVTKRGYFPVYDPEIIAESDNGLVEREYRLIPIPYRQTVFVDLVYYDLDKSLIREDAAPILDKVASLMEDHGYLDLEVRSHTDSRASDAYNEQLSHDRADAVSAYLGSKGIDSGRVKEAWFGEEIPVNDCADGAPCAEWQYQLNRRSELVLMAFSEEGKEYELPADLMDLCDIPNLGVSMDVPTVYFDFDRSTLRPKSISQLDRVALLLHERPEMGLSLGGHTDIRGSEGYNEGLSERRAEVVRDYLVGRGIEADRISYEWFGKTRPVHDCTSTPCTESEHQLNRRTEIRLMVGDDNINTSSSLNIVPSASPADPEVYIVAGVFSNKTNADRQLMELQQQGLSSASYFFDSENRLYYCYVGRYTNEVIASAELDRMKRKGLADAWMK